MHNSGPKQYCTSVTVVCDATVPTYMSTSTQNAVVALNAH